MRAVFEMVSNDPSMDPLFSVLSRNRKYPHRYPKFFYQIRNDRTEERLQQTEDMVRQTVHALSEIIDQQMHQRSCLPLRPDLVEFYDLIMKSMSEQQKLREKRMASLSMLNDDSKDMRFLDAKAIEQKSRVVKKLLRQYEDLPADEQRNAAAVRDELLMDLIYLRKMSETLERTQRNAQLQDVLKKSSGNEAAERQIYSDYSPRFIKLLKTSEVFKQVGEQQAKAYVGL